MALAALALRAGRRRRAARPAAEVGPELNAAIWTILALRPAAGPSRRRRSRTCCAASPPPAASVGEGVAPDSNDTAAAIQALRAAGVTGRPIARALASLARFRNADGGFALTRGRASDSQSTAWAIQAYLAAGRSRRAPPTPSSPDARARRQLPLLGSTRDSGLGDRAGGAGARREAILTAWSPRS